MSSIQSSPFILYNQHHNTLFIEINRPETLNSFNYEMLSAMHYLIKKAKDENLNIVFSGKGRALSAGGDIVPLATGEISSEVLFELTYRLAYYNSLLETERIAFMNGITFGGGVGICWSSSIRVSTPKTLWAMPEVTIGFVPDIGASYHLSRMNPPELGLYLSLTGERMNGVDCYLFGISEYYIEENIDKVINEMYETGNLKPVLEKYHIDPDNSKSKIWPILKDLVYCFNTYLGVEHIMHRLRELGTQWSLKTLEKMKIVCPLSLRIAQEAFRRGSHITYRESFIMEYNLVSQLMHHRAENFKSAVKHKLMTKSFIGVEWAPEEITSIGDTTIRPYFINEEGRKLEFPKL